MRPTREADYSLPPSPPHLPTAGLLHLPVKHLVPSPCQRQDTGLERPSELPDWIRPMTDTVVRVLQWFFQACSQIQMLKQNQNQTEISRLFLLLALERNLHLFLKEGHLTVKQFWTRRTCSACTQDNFSPPETLCQDGLFWVGFGFFCFFAKSSLACCCLGARQLHSRRVQTTDGEAKGLSKEHNGAGSSPLHGHQHRLAQLEEDLATSVFGRERIPHSLAQ